METIKYSKSKNCPIPDTEVSLYLEDDIVDVFQGVVYCNSYGIPEIIFDCIDTANKWKDRVQKNLLQAQAEYFGQEYYIVFDPHLEEMYFSVSDIDDMNQQIKFLTQDTLDEYFKGESNE